METAYAIAGIAGGAAAAAAAGWLLERVRSRAEVATLAARLEERGRRLAELEGEVSEQRQVADALRREAGELRALEAQLRAELEGERRASAEKLKLLGEAERVFREAFQALSSEALRSNNQSFLELARATLAEFQKGAAADLELRQRAVAELVRPIRDRLEEVDKQLREVEKVRIDAYASLREQVQALAVTQQQLQAETANLVRALRVPGVRGRWGEIQLRRVVEMAGMLEHCDFYEQQTADTDDGRLRPDLLVRLPGGRNIVVDAKAPLAAYLDALEAENDEAAAQKLAEHARQVREHMTRLGNKSYWGQFQPSPEFVVMFLPGEMFFNAALRQDAGLIEYGVARRVIPASPTTLIALLQAVAYGWRQEALAENARRISELGRSLYERVRTLASHFEDLRRALERAVFAYNRAAASLESRVLVAARKFRDLKAGSGEEIPLAEPIDAAPRQIAAPELVALSDSGTPAIEEAGNARAEEEAGE